MRAATGAGALLLAAALPLALPGALGAQQRQSDASFRWTGKVPAGRWMRVEDMNGSITVTAGTGDNVEVTAVKQWRHGDPSLVRIETRTAPDGSVTLCALWDNRTTCDDRHSDDDMDRHHRDNDDVSVDFRVSLPRGVKLAARTINGSTRVDGATSDVDARTINGDVDVATTGGLVNATNVNGPVRAHLGRIDGDGHMDLTTVNGSVTADLPADFNGDLELSTVTGSVNANFEMTVSGRVNPHHLRTHVGAPGGARLRAHTVNGSITLHRG